MKFHKLLVAANAFLSLALCGALVLSAKATEYPKNVETLIATKKFRDASLSIFREASAVNPKEFSIAKNMAKAGFLGGAIESAQLQFPVVKTALLLEIAKSAPSLSRVKKNELVQMAYESSSVDIGQNYLRSGDLTLLSFAFMELEQEQKAKSTYEEAINLATKGLNEQGSGGYRRITEQLVAVDLKLIRDWMITSLMKQIGRTPDAFNAAFSYLDLARLQYRLNQRDAAKRLLDSGIAATEKIGADAPRATAVDGLTRFALEMGEVKFAERYGNRTRLLPDYAAFEAERGNRVEAVALASQLQNGLYVGWKSETQSRLVSDAVKRKDLDAAVFYAERLTGSSIFREMEAWTHIAELQLSQGENKAAQASYAKAKDSLKKKIEHEYYSFEIKATLELGKSLIQNGFLEDGRDVVSTAISQIKTIPQRRIEDLISAQTKVAMTLVSIGRTSEAMNLLSDAYREAHAFPQDKSLAQMKKAVLLSEIALAASMLPTARSK